MCGYKCAAERGRLCAGNSPRAQHVRAGPGVFLSAACFLSHISGTEGQSYYTTESCLHSTAASMVRLNRPAYSLDGPAPKAGLCFMGQFVLDSSDLISGFDGKLKFGIFFLCVCFVLILIQRQVSRQEDNCFFL